MKLKKVVILACLLFLCLGISVFALSGKIEFFTASYKVDGNNINVNFTIKNSGDRVYKDVKYTSVLYYSYSNGVENTIDVFTENINIAQYETKNISFTQKIPQNAPKGEYYLVIDILDISSNSLAKKLLYINNIGSGQKYLAYNLNDVKFLTDKGEEEHLSGPSYEANISPLLKLKLKNIHSSKIDAKAYITIYNRHITYDNKPVYKDYIADISIDAGEEKEFRLNLPKMSKPESYYAQIQFIDDKGELVSGILECRYVVKGVSGKILKYTFSEANNKLAFNVELIGPADSSTLENAVFKLTLRDKTNNNIIVDKESIITISKENNTVDDAISIGSDLKEFYVDLKLLYNKQILDSITSEFKREEVKVKPMFIDIGGNKYLDSIMALAHNNVIKGYPDGTFKPRYEITRAEFSKLICFLIGKGEEAVNKKYMNVFKDVNENFWGAGYIQTIYDNGYIKGYPSGEFKPNNKITYEEAITIVVNVLNEGKQLQKDDKFWYRPYLMYAEEVKLFDGVPYSIGSNIIRDESAYLMHNAFNILRVRVK